jgi:hypothetical protein
VKLESAGVGRHSVRLSLVVLGAMRAVACLAPTEVEAIRAVLLARGKLYAATMVSLVAYQGLRVPEELLALECRHVRRLACAKTAT